MQACSRPKPPPAIDAVAPINAAAQRSNKRAILQKHKSASNVLHRARENRASLIEPSNSQPQLQPARAAAEPTCQPQPQPPSTTATTTTAIRSHVLLREKPGYFRSRSLITSSPNVEATLTYPIAGSDPLIATVSSPTGSSSAASVQVGQQQQQSLVASLAAKCSSTLANSRYSSTYTAEHWSFLFALPHLIMMSNLQSFFGAKNAKKPSIQPNDYMDGAIANMKAAMQERGLHEMQLPDQEFGVVLYNGQMTGLTNLSRRGDALLEAETDHFLLTFGLQAKDVRAAYWWRKRSLKGEVSANVHRVILHLKIKQMLPSSVPPELIDFQVEEIEGVQVSLQGLGPLNWLVKRALRAFLRRHLREYLEREGRGLIEQELQNAIPEEQGFFSVATMGIL